MTPPAISVLARPRPRSASTRERPTGFAGAVLTGGRSTRMGRDKATLPVHGVPMAERARRALVAAGADPVFGVGPGGVPDAEGDGPLAGILAALRHSPAGAVVVLACDMPDADPAGIAAVVEALVARPDAQVAVPVVGGRPEPLHAAWRAAAAEPAVTAAVAAGERAVHRVLATLAAVEVEGLDPAWFKNVNEPGDVAG